MQFYHSSVSWKTLAGLTGLSKAAGRGGRQQQRQRREKAGGCRTRCEDRTSDQMEASRPRKIKVGLTGPALRREDWGP